MEFGKFRARGVELRDSFLISPYSLIKRFVSQVRTRARLQGRRGPGV